MLRYGTGQVGNRTLFKLSSFGKWIIHKYVPIMFFYIEIIIYVYLHLQTIRVKRFSLLVSNAVPILVLKCLQILVAISFFELHI